VIPFVDLQAQYQGIRSDLEAAVIDVLASAQYALGPRVERFENAFADYCGCAHAVAVNSGTSALHLALQAAGIGPGDEVVTVPMTFVATVTAILYAGARPVFVDIDPETWTMNPAKLREAITPRTRAILPVHLHGLVAEMAPIMSLARAHGLTVIEDAAQAHGAIYRGQRAGGIGHIGCFSFYPSKNLGACGEGGALVTNDPAIADTARRLRDWGQDGKYNHVMRGHNYRMDAIQGAVLEVKLRHLNRWTEARRAHALRYSDRLACTGWTLPWARDDGRHVYHVYAPAIPNRRAVQRRLAEAGIATGIHYPRPVHLQPAFADLGYDDGDFPISERFAHATLSLPMFPELTEMQIDCICEVAAGLADLESNLQEEAVPALGEPQ
jgi:dTDP-4-amino-4,6-dideoxygalactose transaminase